MNDLLSSRLDAIRQALMAHHQGGRGLPNDTIGEERQFLIDRYLREVLPPLYRFGSGVVVDPQGTSTGALDVVMELPFAPNFPMPGGGNQRLYLAESVASVLEVKSDLYKQWDQAKATINRVKALQRNLRTTSRILLESSPAPIPKIDVGPALPCYVVSYTGHKTAQALADLLAGTEAQSRPDGVLIIESGAFVGRAGQTEGAKGLFRLVTELVAQTNAVLQLAYPNLQVYL
jgi:hypothetical protein